ncbi:MAG: hypothetical protein V9G12_22770 [Microthrixaceae bacterium]
MSTHGSTSLPTSGGHQAFASTPGYLQRLVTGSDLLGKEYREHLDALLQQARADDGAAPR